MAAIRFLRAALLAAAIALTIPAAAGATVASRTINSPHLHSELRITDAEVSVGRAFGDWRMHMPGAWGYVNGDLNKPWYFAQSPWSGPPCTFYAINHFKNAAGVWRDAIDCAWPG